MLKNCKVVMLPTNEKAKGIAINYRCDPVGYGNLCITNDDKIKDGDWVLSKLNEVVQFKKNYDSSLYKKIIATTDSSLQWLDISEKNLELARLNGLWKCLPQPSQSFIQKYIEEYNKVNQIVDVLVEYENGYINNIPVSNGILKVNLKDNTITIKKMKNSWSREEVMKILVDYSNDLLNQRYKGNTAEVITKWIEENI